MTRGRASGRRRGAPGDREMAREAAVAPPPSRAAWLLVAGVAWACVALAVTFKLYDPDLWQHLAVGRALWALHRIPQEHLWTWPSWGQPDVLPSWLFRALLWPWYAAGGVWGVQAWRWATALGAFALLLATARRMGARGLAPYAAIVLCALVYRQRSMARPETLVAVLFALELLWLEARRRGARAHGATLVLILWAWVNAHTSFLFGWAVAALYALDEALPGGTGVPRERRGRPLALLVLLGMAAGLANPFGWRALWQPFDFFLHQRSEPLFRAINELQPVRWGENLLNGLPLVVLGWPLLALLRPARGRADRVEWALMALFLWLGLSSQRFVSFLALAAAPFLAVHLDALLARLAARRWLPAALALACAAPTAAEVSLGIFDPGVGFELAGFPVAACDFMAAHGVRGRGLNYFEHGGWLLWRFWPDRGRLPFIDIHQSGTPASRLEYVAAFNGPRAWRLFDGQYRFDWLLLRHSENQPDAMLDNADADSAFALVFDDDDAALYVRRAGALAAVADSFAYRTLAGGPRRLDALEAAVARDTALRAQLAAELTRAIASSPRCAGAHARRAGLELRAGRLADAGRDLAAARAIRPDLPGLEQRLGIAALLAGQPREALVHLDREALRGGAAGNDYWRGRAWQALGDPAKAREAYAREVAADPDWPGARDSLARLGGR